MTGSRRAVVASAILAAAAAASGPLAAESFQGVVHYAVHSGDRSGATDVGYMTDGSTLRFDVAAQGMNVYALLDLRSGIMTSVMPAQKMYMSMNLGAERGGEGPAPSGPAPRIERTGRTETIAGHTCEHVVITPADGTPIDICGARDLGNFLSLDRVAGAPGGAGLAIPQGWEQVAATFEGGFFPLKIERIDGGKRETLIEATRVERKQLDPALFTVPPGFREMDLGGAAPPRR